MKMHTAYIEETILIQCANANTTLLHKNCNYLHEDALLSNSRQACKKMRNAHIDEGIFSDLSIQVPQYPCKKGHLLRFFFQCKYPTTPSKAAIIPIKMQVTADRKKCAMHILRKGFFQCNHPTTPSKGAIILKAI